MRINLLLLGIVLAGIFAAVLLIAGGPSGAGAGDEAAAVPTPPASQDPVRYRLRLGHNTPIDSALHTAAMRFAERLARDSDGRVEVTVFPDQQLGNDHQMVEMARAGELDLLLTPTAKLSVAIPEMQYADLPFHFRSREELYAMLDGEPGRMLLERLRRIGLVGAAFWENGFKHFTANRPLLAPADFAGLRIRTMKSRLIMEQFELLGATPVPIDFHAVRQALADGVVDGQENPLVAIVSMGFHQVQSDLTLSGHGYLGYVFSISEKVFDGLPPEVGERLIGAARELAVWEREETRRREVALLAEVEAAGVRVHRLGEAQRQAFEEALHDLPRRFAPVIGTDLLEKTEELRRLRATVAGDAGVMAD